MSQPSEPASRHVSDDGARPAATGRRWRVAAVAGGVVLLAAAGAASVWRYGQAPAEDPSNPPSVAAPSSSATAEATPASAESDAAVVGPAESAGDPAPDPDDGAMTLPSVEPALPGDAFCAAYDAYTAVGGPYSSADAGDDLPPFTAQDLASYQALRDAAPAAVKPLLERAAAYGEELARGDTSHLIDNENTWWGPDGVVLYATVYCSLDLSAV